MDLINTYIEMMGDLQFALYVAGFVFGFVLLIGLIAKWLQGNTLVVHKTEDRREPNANKKESHQKENHAEEKNSQEKKLETLEPPAPPAPLEGVMMWEFDDGKKKKGKKPSLPILKAGAGAPPPASEAPTSAEKAIVLPPPPLVPASSPEDKTVILPLKEVAGVQSALPAYPPPPPVASPPPPPAISPKQTENGEVSEKTYVDFQMYETLLRRIAGLEADLKREPLYLDPLMKRIGTAEKRLEELNSIPGKAGGASAPADIKDLTEKVLKLQKVLEQLSEGPSSDVPPKS